MMIELASKNLDKRTKLKQFYLFMNFNVNISKRIFLGEEM